VGTRKPRCSKALPSAFWNMKPIAPCVSPTAYCTGTVGTWPSAISERRRMKPTCGPLPCVSTTFQPAAIIAATCVAVMHTASYWSARAMCLSSTIKALPPTATTARGLFMVDRSLRRRAGPAPSPRR
jgi:hypothetical protein